MKSKHRRLLIVTMLVLFGVLTALFLLGEWFLRQRQEQARLDYLPPVVRITEPENGVSAAVGSYLPVASAITFSPQSPVRTVEWYLDGVLEQSGPPQSEAGASYEPYDLLVPAEGTHMLVARAIDELGVIGQSQPLTFQGVAKGEAFYAVTVNEGDTLDGLAAAHGSDAATLRTQNPGLSDPPVAGTTVKVPIPPGQEPPVPSAAPPAAGGVTLESNSPMLGVADTIPSNTISLLADTPPPAPANLQGEAQDCQVKLLWEDNATNESGYEVWMATPGSPDTRLATLQPASGGVAWYEFPAPGPGYFLFWVEAVNAIGQQGSNVIHLNLDAGCPPPPSSQLQIELLDVSVSGNYDLAYCYVSIEGAPEVRVPEDDSSFIQIQGGQGSAAEWPHAFAYSIPADNSLDLEGECWGWSGGALGKIGNFAGRYGPETWDGAAHMLDGGALGISISIKPPVPDGRGTFAERSPGLPGGGVPAGGGFLEEAPPVPKLVIDPSIPPPYDLREESVYGKGFHPDRPWTWPDVGGDCYPPCKRLRWRWDGDPKKIDGFVVFQNADDAASAAADARDKIVKLPGECSRHVAWRVAAFRDVKPNPRVYSPLSPPVEYDLPACQRYLRVSFDGIWLSGTSDGVFDFHGRLEAYFKLSVGDVSRSFYGGNFFLPLESGGYSFARMVEPYQKVYGPRPELFTIPLDDETADALWIRTRFWDDDPWPNSDDVFGMHSEHPFMDKSQCSWSGRSAKTIDDDAISDISYTLAFYPNPCRDTPPDDGGF